MARIRTIKPDAFKSETLSAIPRGSRWTFAGLWTYLDDSGRGRADVRLIKAELYPLDDLTTAADVDEDITALIEQGCIHTYNSGGRVYIHAPEFLRHQRISHPTKSGLPPCPCESEEHSRNSREDSRELPEPSSLKGREGKGNGSGGEARDSVATTRPPRYCPKHPKGTDDPCGKCADARKDYESWKPPTLSGKTTMCGEHPKRRALNCPECASETTSAPEGWRAS